MSKETWQNKFLKAGTENSCGDLSIMISTVSDIREEAVLEERRRVSEAISNENIDLTDDEYIDVKTFRNTILALINKDK